MALFTCEFGTPRRWLQFDTEHDSGLISALLLDEHGTLLASRVLDLAESPLVAKVIAAHAGSGADERIARLLPALFPE
ncbi:MAG: hypothetical protein ACRDP4_00030 [Nocardioidaceae bacterium]